MVFMYYREYIRIAFFFFKSTIRLFFFFFFVALLKFYFVLYTDSNKNTARLAQGVHGKLSFVLACQRSCPQHKKRGKKKKKKKENEKPRKGSAAWFCASSICFCQLEKQETKIPFQERVSLSFLDELSLVFVQKNTVSLLTSFVKHKHPSCRSLAVPILSPELRVGCFLGWLWWFVFFFFCIFYYFLNLPPPNIHYDLPPSSCIVEVYMPYLAF